MPTNFAQIQQIAIKAVRQAAIASAGTAASLIRGAAVETATSPIVRTSQGGGERTDARLLRLADPFERAS